MVEIADGSAKIGDVWNAFRDEVPSFTTLRENKSAISKRARYDIALASKNLRKSTRSQWTHGQKDADNGFLRRQFVDRESLEVDDKDHHREGNPDSP